MTLINVQVHSDEMLSMYCSCTCCCWLTGSAILNGTEPSEKRASPHVSHMLEKRQVKHVCKVDNQFVKDEKKDIYIQRIPRGESSGAGCFGCGELFLSNLVDYRVD